MTQQRSEVEQLSRKQASGSVLKALDAIEVLARGGRPLELGEVARRLGIPSPSAHRMLRTLELRGYVANVGGRYRLTLKLFELGSLVVSSIDVVSVALPVCEALCDQLQETVNMSVRSGASAVYVMKLDSPRSLRLISHLGMHVPLYCTAMGKVLLAFEVEAVREALLAEMVFDPRTKNTLASRTALVKELFQIVQRGYAVDNQEFEPGLVCVAAPVFDRNNTLTAAISATGPTTRLPRADWPRVGAAVQEAARAISNGLGRDDRGGVAKEDRRRGTKEDQRHA